MATKGVNKVILVGNLGADPETRYTTSGTAICTFSLATSESWTDKQSGEKQERTEWHPIQIFGRLGEIAQEYLKKGRQVYIEGSIRTDKFTGKDGVEKYFTDIIASEMQMLGTGGGTGGSEGGGGHRERPPQQRSSGGDDRSRAAPAPRQAPQQHADQSFGENFSDDDITFDFLRHRTYW